MKKMSLMMILIITALNLSAQNEDDALRYSWLGFGSTARSMGMAGAFGALGGDFSVLSTNPAGIGLYKKSEFTFTPSIYYGKVNSTYNNNMLDDFRYNFNVGNLGLVLTFPGKDNSESYGWKNFQFGIGLNRISNFNNRYLTQGENTQSSILDAWLKYANGNPVDNLNEYDTKLAFYTWLLDTIAGNPTHYFTAKPDGGVMQRLAMTTEGSMSEWVISFGGNYSDMLYLGATLGFPFLNYNEERAYSEEALFEGTLPFDRFRKMSYNQNLDVNGSGFNFKFGFIIKPVEFVRIGGSIHTPTYFYQIKEVYSSGVRSSFDNGDNYSETSPEGHWEYKLNTPLHLTGSLGFVIGKIGLVSADYERVDYSESRLRSDNAEDYFEANDAIRTKYSKADILRVGTEWRIEQFSLRGGYALYGSPVRSGSSLSDRTSYTFGFGFRQDNYFLDFACVLSQSDERFYLYNPADATINPVKNEFKSQNFLMTLGFKF